MYTRGFQFLLSMTLLTGGRVHAQSDSLVIPLWKNGAPGFENKKNEPEEAKDYWVKNINNPSSRFFFLRQELPTVQPY